jgi:hypothetical protein
MTEQELAAQLGNAVATALVPYMSRIENRLVNVEERVVAFVPRHPLTDSVKARHREVVARIGGRCPCCGERVVLDADGCVLDAEYDHWYSRERRAFEDTWLICRPCHRRFAREGRTERSVEFHAYQRKAARAKASEPTQIVLT